MNDDKFSLALLPRRLLEHSGKTYPYGRLHKQVMNGLLPASRESGRWFISAADLPLISQLCDEGDLLPRRVTNLQKQAAA